MVRDDSQETSKYEAIRRSMDVRGSSTFQNAMQAAGIKYDSESAISNWHMAFNLMKTS
jgi:hypothetical protein